MVSTLANRIETTTARASRDGSLVPIPTETRIVVEDEP